MILSTSSLWLAALALLPQDDTPGPGVQESSSCRRCHSNAESASAMRDPAGHGIAPYDLWSGSMMAHSARDPLWQAAVSAEIAAMPERREEIERTCLACHAPMAAQIGLADHGTGSLLHVLECDSSLGGAARDGVSCTICHGISPEGLGTEASFTAGFHLNDERRLFGPHASPFAMPMRRMTGFTPTHGTHVLDSALCGSCHTLITDTFDGAGERTGGEFLEQAPYLEWRNSAYVKEGGERGALAATCQDCHLPTATDAGEPVRTRIARNPGGRDFPPVRPRDPFGRHVLAGGNTLVLSILLEHADELGLEAARPALKRTLQATREQLAERSARVSLHDVEREGRRLAFEVEVENLTGHKLPTAHPTRRAWLRVVVRDEENALLFTSGRTDERGRIVDGRGHFLAYEIAGGPIPPHRTTIRREDEVAIYQAVVADSEGRPSHTLLRGASWLRDTRLLPKGWSADHADAGRTEPVGVEGDGDFRPGFDRVRYELDVPAGADVKIEASLLYQSLSARWAEELFRWETPQTERFRRYYENAEVEPEVMASATLGVARSDE